MSIILFWLVITSASAAFTGDIVTSKPPQHPSSIEYRLLLEDESLYLSPATRRFLAKHADRLDDIVRELQDPSSSMDLIEAVKTVTRVNIAPKQNEYPIAYLFGGGAGAGKTGLTDTLEDHDVPILHKIFRSENKNLTDDDYVLINGDDIMGVLPCYMNDNSPCRANNSTWEGGEIGDALLAEAVSNKQHVVVDGTLKSVSSATKRLDLFRRHNYTLVVHLGVTRPTAESAHDAYDRAVRTNRWVPISALVNTHASYSKSFPTYTDLGFDNVRLFRNLWPNSTGQLPLWANDSVVLVNEDEYEAFLAKANDTVDSVLKEINNQTVEEGYNKVEECEYNDRYCCFDWSSLDESQEPYLSQIVCAHSDKVDGSSPSSAPSSAAPMLASNFLYHKAVGRGVAMACMAAFFIG